MSLLVIAHLLRGRKRETVVEVGHATASLPASICQTMKYERQRQNNCQGSRRSKLRLRGCAHRCGTCPSIGRNLPIPHTNAQVLSVTSVTYRCAALARNHRASYPMNCLGKGAASRARPERAEGCRPGQQECGFRDRVRTEFWEKRWNGIITFQPRRACPERSRRGRHGKARHGSAG